MDWSFSTISQLAQEKSIEFPLLGSRDTNALLLVTMDVNV